MSPRKQQFRGDGEGLVDLLVEACRREECTVVRERCLEPVPAEWVSGCSSALLDAPLEANRRPQYGGSNKFPARHHARSSSSSSASPAAAAATAAAAQQERSSSSGANKRSKTASSPAQIPRVASTGGSRRLSADHTAAGFACPAVAASPKPESLPMPTGLMSRAMAVRSRSPSPPKDSFFAVSVLAHVHPVAA